MNQLIDTQENAISSNSKWKQIISTILFGLFASWMEWRSFGFIDFSELVWLSLVLMLSVIVIKNYVTQKELPIGLWVIFGMLFWSLWRLLVWIFVDRAGLIFGLISIITLPIRSTFGVDVINLTALGLTLLFILLSTWGNYWVYKHFDIGWMRTNLVYWVLFFAVVVMVAVYSGQQQFTEQCLGITTYTSNLFCHLRSNLGVVGSTWFTLTFLLWGLTFALRNTNTHGVLAILWIIALEPVWIELFFNPSRILGTILIKAISSTEGNALSDVLVTNMLFLNLLPLVVFFVLIPIGLLVLKYEKLRVWWTLSASALTYATMLGMLFRTLEIGKLMFSYSTTERIMFVLMALQLLLPLIIVASMSIADKEK